MPSMTDALDFHAQALLLRAERQRILAGNIANADTPGFQARDMDFAAALRAATRGTQGFQPLAGVSVDAPLLAGPSGAAGTSGTRGGARVPATMPVQVAASGDIGQDANGRGGSATASTVDLAAASGAMGRSGWMPMPSVGELGAAPELLYARYSQDAVDRNTVDMDRERATFADNSVRYEATLRFINSGVRTMLDAMKSHNQA